MRTEPVSDANPTNQDNPRDVEFYVNGKWSLCSNECQTIVILTACAHVEEAAKLKLAGQITSFNTIKKLIPLFGENSTNQLTGSGPRKAPESS